MIDINKFKKLANEIVVNSTKNEMLDWLSNYRNEVASFINFRPIEGKFKLNKSEEVIFKDKNDDSDTSVLRYSIAA